MTTHRTWARRALAGLVLAALFLGGCGDGDDQASETSVGTAATGPDLTTAKAVADRLSAAGLGCDDREVDAPQPAPGFPVPSEILKCTISGQEAGITIYAKEGDTERSRAATSKNLCERIGKTDTEKRSAVYGKFFYVGLANGDPTIGAKIAEATGGEVKHFSCS